MTNNLRNFYISTTIYTFAVSVIQIFIPLYLFVRGFSITSILLLFAISQVGRLVSLPVAAHFSSRLGTKKVLGFSFILQVFYFLLLQSINYTPGSSFIFVAIALLLGGISAFFWLPYWVYVSKISPDSSRGKITARLKIYASLATVAGPLLGGLIIAGFGFVYVFALAISLTILAIYFLLKTPGVSKIRKINFGLINIKKIYPDLVANGFYNFQGLLDGIVWSMFIFIIIPRYESIGLIQTVALLISLAAFYFVGALTDRFNRSRLLFFSSILNSIVGVLRFLASSFFGLFLFNTSYIFTYSLQQIPWSVKMQEHMDQDARTEYMAVFEMGAAVGTFILLSAFIVLIKSMPLKDSLIFGLIVSSLAGLLINLVRK